MLVIRVNYFYFFLIVFCNVLASNANNGKYNVNVDSLKNLVSSLNDDANKVQQLIIISKELNKSNPKTALSYSNDAYIISKK